MSAKHKRPFYVFAAVAAICCMVLVTGIHGNRTDDGNTPVVADSPLTESGALIARSPGAGDGTSSGVDPGATGGANTGSEGGVLPTIPGLNGALTGPDGGDAESGPNSGLIVLPPFDLPLPPVVDPPVTDDTSDDSDRGERGGKKDKGKDKDEQGDEPGDEATADAESEDEVDPDVYALPEDEGDEGDGGTEGNGDSADGPVDPETTP